MKSCNCLLRVAAFNLVSTICIYLPFYPNLESYKVDEVEFGKYSEQIGGNKYGIRIIANLVSLV